VEPSATGSIDAPCMISISSRVGGGTIPTSLNTPDAMEVATRFRGRYTRLRSRASQLSTCLSRRLQSDDSFALSEELGRG
jgi:hypothetical protein